MATATREIPAAAAAAQRDRAPSTAIGGLLPVPAALALAAVRAAAIACQPLVGRGDGHAADGAATAAMRETLAAADGRCTVVVGEGEKDQAPMLFAGEELGRTDTPAFDVAVDPLEGTKVCACGLPGALATIALAPAGSLWRPGPSLYLEKLIAGPAARDALDINRPAAWNVAAVAEAVGRRVTDIRVVILDKPRHTELIENLRQLGVQIRAPLDGDVAASIATLTPDGNADLLIGVGGTPEGVMSAIAVEALGGEMLARPAPQRDSEAGALRVAGIPTTRVLRAADIAPEQGVFAACGVSGGELVKAPRRQGAGWSTESLLVTPGTTRRLIETTTGTDGRRDGVLGVGKPGRAEAGR